MRICFVSGTRAEFGITRDVVSEARAVGLDAGYLLCGSHGLAGHAEGRAEVEQSGLPVFGSIATKERGDSSADVLGECADLLRNGPDALKQISADCLFLTGDRHETFALAVVAHFLGLPFAHLHGGELTFGAIDEGLRHSISKMASQHFTTTLAAKQRLERMGEQPESVHFVGAPALQTSREPSSDVVAALYEKLGFAKGTKFALCTIHPVTMHPGESVEIVSLLQKVFRRPELVDTRVVVTAPNVDAEGQATLQALEEAVAQSDGQWSLHGSLGRQRYHAAMWEASFMIGNSSSGIIEAASFALPVVNIGDRQKGREHSDNVLDVAVAMEAIASAVDQCLTPEFKKVAADTQNPYYKADSAKQIAQRLKDNKNLMQHAPKEFFDGI